MDITNLFNQIHDIFVINKLHIAPIYFFVELVLPLGLILNLTHLFYFFVELLFFHKVNLTLEYYDS